MSYITTKNVDIGYDNVIVTHNLNFQINQGDYLCIVGENGAGKSTLMKTILGFLKPINGKIEYDDIFQKNGIGYLPQQTVVQKDFPASVWEIVLSGTLSKCGHKPFFEKKEKEIAKENMEKMNIWELRRKCYRNLSGGQQQRVLLAKALCATENLLILDEPTNGLDLNAKKDFYELIQKINKQGITIIMISHDLTAIKAYASHILHIGKSQLFFGETQNYLNSDTYKIFAERENGR